jgi:hypothetical protein
MSFSPFARALLDPELPCPGGLRAHNGSDPAVRFAVYRNNVVASLIGALGDGFPVVRQLVGDEFFAAMARMFIVQQPPRSPVLSDWGDTFASFIEDFEPAATVPYLADIARLERARVRAFHAADAPSLGRDEIAPHLADPATLAGSRMQFHPSAQIVGSDFAIVALWAAHHGHGDIAHVDPFVPQAALVLREDDDAAVIGVPPVAAVFFRQLAQGDTLAHAAGEAGAAAVSIGTPFDLAQSLGILIRHRVLVAWHHPEEGRE